MRKVKIITDSCSDLTPELLEKYGIDYAEMSTVYNGVETPARLTWSDDEVHAFYNVMREGNRITTAQVSAAEFHRIFGKYLDEGYDIVYVGCSSKQSGSVNTGAVCAKKLLESYPDASIFCVDSLNASMGEGVLAIEAAKYAENGKSAAEVAEYAISIRKKINQYVTVHSLDALRRAGRVSASSAFLGNLMGVKPILISDVNGVQVAYKKVKGRQTSFKEIVSLLKDSIEDAENSTVYIAHADCSDAELELLTSLVKEQIGCREIEIGYIGPIIGASIGPDAVAIWGIGKEVTFGA